MTPVASFDPPRILTDGPEGYAFLAVMVAVTSAGKVPFAHVPFLFIGLARFKLSGNALAFVGFHAAALTCAAAAMRCPPFRAGDGPALIREAAPGV